MPARESKKTWAVWKGPGAWCQVGAAEVRAAGLASNETHFLEVMRFTKERHYHI